MSDDFTRDDIGQMRKDGDLRAFMRGQFRRPSEQQEAPAAAQQSHEAGRPPGAWPAGAHWPGCTSFGTPDGSCPCGAGTVSD